jgi:hypothetical protein
MISALIKLKINLSSKELNTFLESVLNQRRLKTKNKQQIKVLTKVLRIIIKVIKVIIKIIIKLIQTVLLSNCIKL